LIQTSTPLYGVLRPIIKAGFKVFLRRIQIVGTENLPQNKPIILVANHQNAMLDPVICCCFFPQQLHWLTRADVFKNPTIKKLLFNFNMLPVYRERDRVEDMQTRNQEIFEIVNQRLKHNATICLFPEGTHRGKKQLMPLKKGVVRMATGTVEAGIENALIVPVGIDYEDYYGYRKDVLIVIGKPIPLALYETSLKNDPARAQNVLLQDIRSAMRKVMIDIDHDNEYDVLIGLRPLINEIAGGDLQQQFNFYHHVLDTLPAHSELAAALQHKGKIYLDLQQKINGDDSLHALAGWHNLGAVCLGLLFATIGFIFFAPLYYCIESIQKKLVKDPLFINSIRIVAWTFITPFYLLLLALVIGLTSLQWWQSIAVVGAIVVCGRVALWWNEYFKRIKYSYRLSRINISSPDLRHAFDHSRSEVIEVVLQIQRHFRKE
jgi:1-acyl-sn-glycerol-3-phosphate acyltransferase